MSRLNQQSHAFIALTSVSVVGPDTEMATPFVAVNRDLILAAEETVPEEQDGGEREKFDELSFEVVDD